LFSASGTHGKTKPPTHQAAVFSPPAEILFGEFPHHTSSGTFVPDQGTLALHCQVARLVSESFLMLIRIVLN
jgi:hypothetical protein